MRREAQSEINTICMRHHNQVNGNTRRTRLNPYTHTHAQDVGVRPKQCIITRLVPFSGIYHAQFIEDPFRDHTALSPTGERKRKKKTKEILSALE